ncbi:hypothetical protein [Phyllobacterium sp. OV277]|jgi:inactivated superfamily I helicase|uniref:hypothetical protein n=1 Tax=Phyllobacterium sp. OV277 TaxID=1882772 RepID=UPI00087F1F49|nr:hypothetical protein [Phyllobacterium sp. OV277]SDP82823.1 hypothetical protein SAMN05443582_11162 [Phyllobacterium sp. OV277]
MGLISAMPKPEDVFVSWLIQQPRNTDLAAAAALEVARLRRHAGHPGVKRLHDLFCALISAKEAGLRPKTSQLRQ